MKLLAWLTETFITTFGITRPRPEQQRTAPVSYTHLDVYKRQL